MSDLLASASRVPDLELELRTDTQFATAYLRGRPFATVQRARALDSEAPRWQAFGLDGQRFSHAATARSMVRLVEARAAWCAALALRNVTQEA